MSVREENKKFLIKVWKRLPSRLAIYNEPKRTIFTSDKLEYRVYSKLLFKSFFFF